MGLKKWIGIERKNCGCVKKEFVRRRKSSKR